MLTKPKKWSGKPIALPGIYHGMPLERYHAADACIEPSISSSGLRTIFNESPAHYWCKSPYNPNRIEDAGTDAMTLGRAAHHLIMGEPNFKSLFTMRPESINGETWHGSKTICKVWLRKQAEANLTVLTPTQIDHVKGIATSLAAEPLVQHGILNGLIENSMFWKHEATGIWLKSRPDATPNDSLDFADLKLTRSVQWRDLQKTIAEYGYHQQGALVGTGCRALFGVPMNSFTLVFVENTPPYCVEIVTLKDNDLKLGERANEKALKTFADCFKTKRWPGPRGNRDDARYIELPEWSQKAIEAELAQ